MHTEYYVNGKKSDLSGYLSAADENEYREKAFKKAKKYYQENPQEWDRLYSFASKFASKDTIGIMMLMDYENTEEGRRFREEWMANRDKRLHRQAGCGFFFYLAIILGSIITLICMV